MGYWSKDINEIEKEFETDLKNGLNSEKINDKRGTLRI